MMIPGRQRWLGLGAIVAVALWAGDRLVLGPLVQSWKDRSARIAELRQRVQQGAQLAERDRAIRARWDFLRTNSLPAERSIAENLVLKAFERWSQESRVVVNSIKPQWKESGDGYATLECRVDASGNLSALTRFLYEIERDPLAIRLDLVEITAPDARAEQLTLGLLVSGLQLKSSGSRTGPIGAALAGTK